MVVMNACRSLPTEVVVKVLRVVVVVAVKAVVAAAAAAAMVVVVVVGGEGVSSPDNHKRPGEIGSDATREASEATREQRCC